MSIIKVSLLLLVSLSLSIVATAQFPSTPILWTTPDYLTTTENENGGTLVSWKLIDMNGDNSPDLVYPYRWGGMGGPGNYYWEVYLNNGANFAATPILWSIPENLNRTTDETGTTKRWRTIDMNGDLLPDLVFSYRWGGLGGSGNYYWEVYLNNGAGFNPTPINWTTPDQLTTTSDETGGASVIDWNIKDMNGDNAPDLIYCNRWGGMGGPGNYYWEIYLNNGTGFNTSPIFWSTPNQLPRTEDQTGSPQIVSWKMMDMNGDNSPDLVYPYRWGGMGSPGNYYWEVYFNNGTGFDLTPFNWTTPDQLQKTSDETGNYIVNWNIADMNGDSLPDLVYPYRWGGMGSPGNYYWEVYFNNGTSFDLTPFNWSTPGYISRISDETGNSFANWNIIDMNGDNAPDLVYPYRWGGMGGPGNYYWEVYIGGQIITTQETLSQPKQLTIYPNPTSKELTINMSSAVTNIRIFDLSGRSVKFFDANANTLDVSELPTGTYFLRFTSEGRIYSERFVKD